MRNGWTVLWQTRFPMVAAENITWDGSDHIPIILYLCGNMEDERQNFREANRPFRFEARWVHHDDFERNMRNVWGASKNKFRNQWSKMVEECGSKLKQWHKDV